MEVMIAGRSFYYKLNNKMYKIKKYEKTFKNKIAKIINRIYFLPLKGTNLKGLHENSYPQ